MHRDDQRAEFVAAWSRDKIGAVARVLELPRLQLALRAVVVGLVAVVVFALASVIAVLGAAASVLWVTWEAARKLAGAKDGS